MLVTVSCSAVHVRFLYEMFWDELYLKASFHVLCSEYTGMHSTVQFVRNWRLLCRRNYADKLALFRPVWTYYCIIEQSHFRTRFVVPCFNAPSSHTAAMNLRAKTTIFTSSCHRFKLCSFLFNGKLNLIHMLLVSFISVNLHIYFCSLWTM